MAKKRLFNCFSLIINLSILYFMIDTLIYNFRPNIIKKVIVAGFEGTKIFGFFTVLSNLLLAIACAITLYYNIKGVAKDEFTLPKWLYKLKFAGTVSTALTMVMVIFLLAPYCAYAGRGYFLLFESVNFYLHFLSPVLGIVAFAFFEKSEGFEKKDVWLGLIPTALYGIFYVVMVVVIGEESGGWPDFYGLTFGGKLWAIPISAVCLFALTYLLSWGLYSLSKKADK